MRQGGEAHLRWVAPAFGGLLLEMGKNDLEKILRPKSKIGPRYAILWPICRLFCFINFF